MSIAEAINALPEEIYFTSGGVGERRQLGNQRVGFSRHIQESNHYFAIEHHAVLVACEAIERLGYPVVYINPDSKGSITPDVLDSTITDNTRLVSVMYSNNEIGTIEPVKELAQIAHGHGALFHTDAVQAIGHINIDVKALGVDMLSASAHKFNGPSGIGFFVYQKASA